MKSIHSVFSPGAVSESEEHILKESLECLQNFSDAFDAEDLNAMDEALHFPHFLLSGSEMSVWERPGQMPHTFFKELRKSGWRKTVCTLAKPILISKNKVHYLWHYNRFGENRTLLTHHENVWIVTKEQGRWAIKVRSY